MCVSQSTLDSIETSQDDEARIEVFSIRCTFRSRAHLTLLLSSFFKNQLQIQYDFN